MTRHAKNCTAGAVYTYHEKKKDTKTAGYGTQALRLGKDAVKDFDCCSLSLQPCRDPVITHDGYLYDKEAILEYILHQKREITRRLKEYEKQKRQEQAEKEEIGQAEHRSRLEKFIKKEQSIVTDSHNPFKGSNEGESSNSVSNMVQGKDKMLPSFWIPNLTPDAKTTVLKKPDKVVHCPMSGRPLAMKDLIPVNFTLVKDPDDKASLIIKKNRYMCAVTHDILGNTVPCAVLRPSGNVVTMECIEKLIKKDWTDPVTGDKLKEKDIIPVQMGGTGYATTNENLAAAVLRPPMQA